MNSVLDSSVEVSSNRLPAWHILQSDELQLGNLTTTTANTYVRAIERFANFYNKSPEQLRPEQVREYLLHLRNDNGVASNTILINRSALRFVYVETLKQKWFDEEVARPKRRPTLPGILSADEVTRILDHTTNLKHWPSWRPSTPLRCAAMDCYI